MDWVFSPLSFFALFILFCLWSAWAIRKEARGYLERAQKYTAPKEGFELKFPSWWQYREKPCLKSQKLFELIRVPTEEVRPNRQMEFFDPEGEGRLLVSIWKKDQAWTGFSRVGLSKIDEAKMFARNALDWDRLSMDRFEPESWVIHQDSHRIWNLELESRSGWIHDQEAERLFVRFNWIDSPGFSMVWIYHCGVLAGLVDGYFMRQTLQSLKDIKAL
jgi:hypothetical protein